MTTAREQPRGSDGPPGLLRVWAELAAVVAGSWAGSLPVRALPPVLQVVALLVAYACARNIARTGARAVREGTDVGYLSREAIFAADDVDYADVDVSEWGSPGDKLRIKSISGTQRDAYEASMIEERGKDRKMNLRNARSKLIVLCAVDEHGKKLFTEQADVNRLGAKNARVVERVFDACRKIAGLSEEDVDSLVTDFDETPDEDSPTA